MYYHGITYLEGSVCTAQNKNSLTKIKLVNYKTYLTKQDAQYGSVILVKKNLKHSVIPNLSDPSIAVKVQTSVGPVIFLTAYIPPRINSINPLDFWKKKSHRPPEKQHLLVELLPSLRASPSPGAAAEDLPQDQQQWRPHQAPRRLGKAPTL